MAYPRVTGEEPSTKVPHPYSLLTSCLAPTPLPFPTPSTSLGQIPLPQGHLLEGTGCQAIRQKIGHILFGFRVVYGEVVFVTISPNRRHSSLLLRLSRTRANDTTLNRQDLPYIIPKSGHEVPQAPPGYLGYFVLGSATLSFIIMIKK